MVITHLIGGGPSAADVDPHKLDGFTIGVNEAGLLRPCAAWFSLDHNYALAVRSRLLGLPAATQVHVCVRHSRQHLFHDWRRAKIWTRLDTDEPILDGKRLSSGPPGTPGCSGYVAINLAVALGAREVHLHGYDFDEPYSYWYDDTPFPRHAVPGVLESFQAVGAHYRRLGVTIINHNPHSKVRL